MMRPIIPYKIKTLCIRFYIGPWPGAKRQSLKRPCTFCDGMGNQRRISAAFPLNSHKNGYLPKQQKSSWVNWNLSNKTESSAALAPGASKTGGWSQSEKFEEKHSSLTLN